jgi:protein SCO1/2
MRTGTYRVILFSFDARDTPADLRRFRERHRVPLDWAVATADATSIRALMDSIGFHYAQTNNAFTHPNVVIGITPELKTSGFLFGTSYRSSDVERLLSRSRSARLIDRYAAAIFGLLLFACVMSLVYLVALTRDLPKSRAVQIK